MSNTIAVFFIFLPRGQNLFKLETAYCNGDLIQQFTISPLKSILIFGSHAMAWT